MGEQGIVQPSGLASTVRAQLAARLTTQWPAPGLLPRSANSPEQRRLSFCP
jgi:hypothetical protein